MPKPQFPANPIAGIQAIFYCRSNASGYVTEDSLGWSILQQRSKLGIQLGIAFIIARRKEGDRQSKPVCGV
jgi:hypothetical protein